jgi:hypothetical protein
VTAGSLQAPGLSRNLGSMLSEYLGPGLCAQPDLLVRAAPRDATVIYSRWKTELTRYSGVNSIFLSI